jgi:hypothetical protein
MSQFYTKLKDIKQQKYSLEITTVDGKNHHCEDHWQVEEYDGTTWVIYAESKGKVQFFNIAQITSLNFTNFNM